MDARKGKLMPHGTSARNQEQELPGSPEIYGAEAGGSMLFHGYLPRLVSYVD